MHHYLAPTKACLTLPTPHFHTLITHCSNNLRALRLISLFLIIIYVPRASAAGLLGATLCLAALTDFFSHSSLPESFQLVCGILGHHPPMRYIIYASVTQSVYRQVEIWTSTWVLGRARLWRRFVRTKGGY